MIKTVAFATVATVALTGAALAQGRTEIQIAGSSTVLPYASVVAEEFGNTFQQFPTPVVASGGSSAGLRQFCEGVGENTIDIANASRKIRDREITACAEAGVTDIREIRFAYDAIVFASDINGAAFELQDWHIAQALSAQVPVDGALVDNPFTNWSEIDPSLPDQEILMFIPGENHGTREVFEEFVVIPGCERYAETVGFEMPEDYEDTCLLLRTDGASVDIAGDYTETLARIEANTNGIGAFGVGFYETNLDKLQIAPVNGITANIETITSGEYPVSRYLYFYVKGQHLDVIQGLREYTTYFLSDAIAGETGLLSQQGLVALPSEERAQVVESFFAGVHVGDQ